MRRNFFLLFLLAFFVFVPFCVDAKVKALGDTVYVTQEAKIKCDIVKDPSYHYIGVDNLIGIYDSVTDEVYLYDFSTEKCRVMTDDEYNKYFADEEPDVYYEINNNKLYKIEEDVRLRNYYVLAETITADGVYYKNIGGATFEKIEYTECNTSANNTCYEKKDLLEVYGYSDDGRNYYRYEGNSMVSLITTTPDNVNDFYYVETNPDDYRTKKLIVSDITKFDLKNDGFDYSLDEIAGTNGDNGIITELEIAGKQYIFISSYDKDGEVLAKMYSAEGKIVLESTDQYIEVVSAKNYLVYLGGNYVNDEASQVIKVYNSDFKLIYESQKEEVETFSRIFYLTSYGNSVYVDVLDTKVNDNQDYEYPERNLVIRDYKLLEGNNQTYKNKDLTFKFNGDYKNLLEIMINDKKIDNTKWTAKKGSTIVTLKNDYLKTLRNGTYELKVLYNDGGYSKATFKVVDSAIVDTSADIENPDTFDNIGNSLFMGIVSLIGIIGVAIYMRKSGERA